MTQFFLRIYDFLEKRRWLTVLLVVSLVGLFAFLASRVRYEEDIAKFLPRDEENFKYQEVYQQFAAQDRVVVVFSPKDESVDKESIESAIALFGEKLEGCVMVANLNVTVDETQVFDLMDAVYNHLPCLLEESDYQYVDSLLQTPGFIHGRLVQDKQMLMFPVAGTMMHTLPTDPLQLFTPVLRRLNSLKLNDAFQVVDGYLFTADGKHGILTFDSPFGANESFNNGKLSKYLEQISLEVQKEVPGVEIAAVGAPLIAATNASQIKRDSILAVSVAIVLILLILLLHYRRLSDILWVSASILFGALFSLAGLYLIRGGVSIIVIGIGSVLVGIELSFAFSGRVQRGRRPSGSPSRDGVAAFHWQSHHCCRLLLPALARCPCDAGSRPLRLADARRYHSVRAGFPAAVDAQTPVAFRASALRKVDWTAPFP